MKNKIVQLRNGQTICRILDTIIYNGDTLYLVIDFETKGIITIKPKDISDIVENDPDDKNNFISIKDKLVEKGL